jgi:phosphotransferase system HPr-like phosphotransfer protein
LRLRRVGVLAQAFSMHSHHAFWIFVGASLVGIAGLAVWAILKWRIEIGRLLGVYREITEQIVVADPHGLHMRRCKDLVQAARKHIPYRILVRNRSGNGKTWANAKSITSLLTLGVRGPCKNEKLPVVDVKVYGFRPRRVMRELRKVLETEPQKYLSVYELYELAQKAGGRGSEKAPTQPKSGC